MSLTSEQKETVSRWLAGGDSLADIQQKLSDELGVSMTYMEVRFLIDDLGLTLKEAPRPPEPVVPAPEPVPPAALGEEPADLEEAEAIPAAGGGVSVEIDRLNRPGSVVSGSVTFSDGTKAKWALDQMGRLMLDAAQPGYSPNPKDVQAFQQELSLQLQRHGF